MKKTLLLSCVFTAFTVLTLLGEVYAWETKILDNENLPHTLIVIDKAEENLSYMEKDKSFDLHYVYQSIHGEVEGDKIKEGDLKTPEGVYFVTTRIKMELDFEKYGSQAHALNYPNPVDKLRGKTGGGIWIHSKGDPILNQKTQGCVAIDLDDIAELEPYIKPGMPVIIAQKASHEAKSTKGSPSKKTLELSNHDNLDRAIKTAEDNDSTYEAMEAIASGTDSDGTKSADMSMIDVFPSLPEESPFSEEESTFTENNSNKEIKQFYTQKLNNTPRNAYVKFEQNKEEINADREILLQMTAYWNQMWASRSYDFFDFYDKDTYAKAQGASFERFYKQKDYLFKSMPWIYIKYYDINILQGPDYWVTWFTQYYRAPNYQTEGTRRLYWQKNAQGEFYIIAMEWLPRRQNLEKDFEKHVREKLPTLIEEWRLAWLNADPESYKTFYRKEAVLDSEKGLDAIMHKKKSIWALKKPKKIDFSSMEIDIQNNAIYVKMKQEYADSSGYRDVGFKRLTFYPDGESFSIVSETWGRK